MVTRITINQDGEGQVRPTIECERRGRTASWSMRRWASLAFLMLPAGCGQSPGESPDPASPEEARADSLVDGWIDAAGGLEAWNSVRSARFTVTTVWYDSTGDIRRIRPRRVTILKRAGAQLSRIERPEAEGLYVQVFTGDTAWATLNDALLPADDKAAEESEYVGRDVFYWFGLPYKLRDPGVNRSARELPEGGWEVRVTFGDDVGVHPGDQYFYYFLDDDPYPEEVHYIEQDRTEAARNRTEWSEFRQAAPITYVGTRLWRDSLGMPTKALRIHDVWINPELPEGVFQAPGR